MTSAVVIAADQATKSWAVFDLRHPVHVVGPFGLALAYNSGTAFSLFDGTGLWLVPVAAALVGILAWLAWRAKTTLVALGLGLVLGGALGNLADRVFRGHHGDVVDFITLRHWPTFNVADAAITLGAVLCAAGYLRMPHARRAGDDEAEAEWQAPGAPTARRSGGTDAVPGRQHTR